MSDRTYSPSAIESGLLLGLALLIGGCGEGASPDASEPEPYPFELPEGFPEPFVPSDQPLTEEKVELGRHLFYDVRLSVNGTMSCASCHRQELAFSDGLATPTGATGQHVFRNSMTLTNVAYYFPYTWENSGLETLEEQALVPLFADFPLELGFTTVEGEVLDGFRADAVYATLFPRAFPKERDPFTPDRVVSAIAAFERTLISADSPYDRYNFRGDELALSEQARRGLELFNSERFECYHCHGVFNLTSAFRSSDSMPSKDYQNNGLYNLDDEGSYPAESPGLSGVTGKASDNGKFRVPTLRNVTKTAPYMHDGSIATLEEVLDHYARGGRLIESGPNQGDGRKNPRKSPLVRGFVWQDGEKEALLAFFESLTDESFLTDERFSDPWSDE
jgi:cytochrome c peroxidase